MPNLASTGIAAVGISPDKPAALKKFDDKYGLGFPLLSDPDHMVSTAFATWAEKTRCGKTSMGIVRSSFLIGGDGKIVKAWYDVKPEDTVPKALDALSGK